MDVVLALLWLVLEVAFEAVVSVLDFGSSIADPLELVLDPPSPRFRACLGYALAGFCLGLFSGYVLPSRLLPAPRTSGISLLVSPVVSGVAMHLWGSFRAERGRPATSMATFWGGASFAFGCALGRFVSVG
jgi:hypothetical protein